MSTTVVLSEAEVFLAGSLIALRQSINRQAGVVNQKAGKQDPITTEQVGVYGELAFAKWANVYPDLTTHLRKGSADATFRGWTVDVKSTRNPHGDLWVDYRPDKRADLYVLVHVDGASCALLGWCWFGDVPLLTTDEVSPMRITADKLNDMRYLLEDVEPKRG
jgi:hypothetical protein